MEREIWFKRKRYGWGWYPATWQGWLILLIWILLFVSGEIVFISYVENQPSVYGVVAFLVYTAILVTALIGVSYKYGEAPRWQWGEDNKKGD